MSADSQVTFKSQDFALRAQKKILGQFSNRKAAKVFISDNLSTLLDLLYQLIKSHVRKQTLTNHVSHPFIFQST